MAAGLRELAAADPERVALDDGRRCLTRAGLNDRVSGLQATLRAAWGLDVGDPVAIVAGNSADYVTVLAAASLGGMPPVPVSTHLALDEVTYLLATSGARVVFADAPHEELARAAAARAGAEHVAPMEGAAFDGLVDAGRAAELPDDTPFAGTIYYTSGTTGRPKGARMAMVPSGVPVGEYLEGLRPLAALMGMDESTVHLVQGPLSHAAPQVGAATTTIVGGKCVVMPRWDAEQVLSLVEAHRVDSTIMVPTMFVRLLRLPDDVRARHDLSSLRRVTHTGAPCAPDVKRRMIEWWGPVIIEGYGASEIGAVTQISSEEWLERPGSVGRPLPMFSVRVLDDDGQPLPAGGVGTVWVTGLTGLDIEYLGEAEKTAAAHRAEREFTLGDLGWLDDTGYLYLADRRVDLVVTGGVNVYPAEVEAVLHGHPAVDDVAVFGVPDEEWGQQVRAAIQVRPGVAATPALADEIVAWLRERVAHYKVPRSIDFHDALPRYPNGKLHRRELRDPYWAGSASTPEASPAP